MAGKGESTEINHVSSNSLNITIIHVFHFVNVTKVGCFDIPHHLARKNK